MSMSFDPRETEGGLEISREIRRSTGGGSVSSGSEEAFRQIDSARRFRA